MRPLVRLFIARGIQLPTIVATLKQIYVDVATTEFRLDDKSPTDSRVALLTGLHRRDVSSIRRDGLPGSKPSAMSLPATVIGRWLGDSDYARADGQRVELPLSATDGSPSFETLVHGCSKDIHPRTVLDELIDQGMVDWDETANVVTLTARAFVPTRDDDAMMHFFEMNLHDHLAAATSNIIADDKQSSFLERAVYYNKLSPTSVDDLDALARKRAGDLLAELNSIAAGRQKVDKKKGPPTKRFRFGVFFYSENDRTSEEDS